MSLCNLITKYGAITLFIGSFVACVIVLFISKPKILEDCCRTFDLKEGNNNLSPPLDPYKVPTIIDGWLDTYKTGPLFDRWSRYFYPFERHFGRWRGRKVVVMEIGVQSGGSTKMWPVFFGKGLDYYGVDINPNCLQFENLTENIHIILADQSRAESLRLLMEKIPPPDIIIDDGSHRVSHQNLTFNHLFPYLNSGGVYLIEDLHTSYWKDWEGTSDLKCQSKTMIEESKKWIDILNLEHINALINPMATDKDWLRLHSEIGGLIFYNSMVFVEKTAVKPFVRVSKGDKWRANLYGR